jgi:hypothetical protein
MTAEQAAKRKWWEVKRVQGIFLIIVGTALTVVPLVPDTVGLLIVGTGLTWLGFGAGEAVQRNSK